MVAAADNPRISIIIPALNEAAGIALVLRDLQPLRRRGHEVIVVDGGSHDGTARRARQLADRVISSVRGRARQMNAGAQIATGDYLWFLHADTRSPENADRLIDAALAAETGCWGRFDVQLADRSLLLRCVAYMMNLRSRISGICTGDQGIFMTRAAYEAIGGFADIPLMEDIAASRMLKRLSRPAVISGYLQVSARRWHKHGIFRTIATMWGLRLAYSLGVPARRLARLYATHN